MPNSDSHLSPAETARRFGISIKALRLYEQRGLLQPARSRSGSTGSAWRAYGPDQIARLHQILALKRLGLSLKRIGEILAGTDRLGEVLALQEQALEQDRARLSRALSLVRAARTKLAEGGTLTIDDLATLTQETVMTLPNAKELNKILMPFTDRHISREEKASLKDALKAKGIDREQFASDWNGLMAEWQTVMQAGDPTSPAAQDMARRWSAFRSQLPFHDPEIQSKGKAIMEDAKNDPATAEKLALYREIGTFAEKAIAHWKAQSK